ncbi:MAG: hypothetical protein HYY06_15475 [Deltaproteobacteria bacterium]|nr:hypothetical protein [Deltaproteobacteria bacterium]
MATMRRTRATVAPRLARPERPAERRADAALVGRTLELLDGEDGERAASVRRVGAQLLERPERDDLARRVREVIAGLRSIVARLGTG